MLLNRSGRKYFTFMCILILSGCATVSSDFERASRIDSIRAYEEFLNKYPDTEFEQAAQARRRELEEEKQREKERLAKIEREAWEKTKDHNLVSDYADFIATYPNSNYSIAAKHAIKTLIRDTSLRYVGGDKEKIRGGTDFPINLFSAKDIMEGFGVLKVTFKLTQKNNQVESRKLGSQIILNYVGWQKFYSDIVKGPVDFSSSKLEFFVRMLSVDATVVSSFQPGTTVTFYRVPEAKLGLSIDRNLSYANIENEDLKIWGVGIAILRKNNSVEVYEFTNDGASIFQ